MSLERVLLDVMKERSRQVHIEGFTAATDDEHDPGTLAAASSAYGLYVADTLSPQSQGDGGFDIGPPDSWPFDLSWWKPSDPRTAMIKSIALMVAEVEALDRAQQQQCSPEVYEGT